MLHEVRVKGIGHKKITYVVFDAFTGEYFIATKGKYPCMIAEGKTQTFELLLLNFYFMGYEFL